VDRIEVVEALGNRGEHVQRITLAERVRVARLVDDVDADDSEPGIRIASRSAAGSAEEVEESWAASR
jgi:hypothetical protein